MIATPDAGGGPVSQTFFSSATTETLSGLSNAVPYDVTVAADNSAYAASGAAGAAADNPVTPEALTQTITFTSTPPTSPAFSSTYVVSATGGPSSNDVVFTIDPATTGSACSIVGDVVSFDHAGTCVVDANQLGSGLYAAAPQVQQQIVVDQVRPTITWPTPAAITYGTALDASELDATASVPGSFNYLPASGTTLGVGTRTLAVAFTPTDSNDYTTTTASTTLTIEPVTPTITWPTAPAITYGTALDASELDATASVPGTFRYLPPSGTTLDAGNQTLIAQFTPTDTTDYTATYASMTITVHKATPTLTWPTPRAITFGSGLSSDQLDATASVPGTFTYLPAPGTVLNAGSQTLSVEFTPATGSDYTTASASTTLNVEKAIPNLTWPTPAPITFGTGLSSAQLDATASVPGVFSYAPALGTVEGAGTDTITATFSPTDSSDYSSATTTVALQVGEATPTITWPTPAGITSGTALGSSQLDATADVPGTFSYQPASGSVPAAGSDTLSVKFTPTDASDEAPVTKTVTLVVNKSAPDLSWSTPTAITYGTALGSTQLDASSSVPGTFTYSPAAGATPGAGTATLSATFVPDDTADYASATVQTTIVVNQAVPSLTWPAPSAITAGTALDSSELDATSSVPGTFTYTPAAGATPGAGTTTLSVAFTPSDATDYTAATQTVSLVVNPAAPVIAAPPSTTSTTLSPSLLAAVPAAPSGTVSIVFGFQPGAAITAGTIHVRGHDFLPGSTVTVLAHSAPTLLGTAKVSRNGTFSTVVTLPARLEVGAHHIVVRGTLNDGSAVASEEAFTVASGGLLGTVGSVPPGPLANDVAFVPAAHRATVLATAAGGAVAIGAVASSLGGGFSGSRSGGTGGSAGGGGAGGGGGGYLEDVELEQAEAEMEGGSRGDQSRTWRWPLTRRLDRFSARYPSLVAAVSPVAGRVIIDGAYLRAMFGSVWLFMCLAAVGLGSYASASTGWYAIPPSLPIFLAVLGLSIFDATLGYLAGASFLAGALFSGHITSAMELRTGAGIVLLWFAVPLAAAALRPLRRSLTFNLLGLWDRAADFVIGGLFAAWAAQKMTGALSGLAGVELPIAKDVNAIAFAVLAFVGARIILETIAAHHYPTRLEHVRHRGDLESGNLQVGVSLVIQILLFLFISVAFMGATWGLYVGCAVFFTPLVPWLFADKIPKSKFVTRWKPTGLVNWALIIVTGVFLSRLLDHLVHSDHLVEVLGFIILPLPVLVSWGLELFEAEEEEGNEEAEIGAEEASPEHHGAHSGGEDELVQVFAYVGAVPDDEMQLAPLPAASGHHGAEEPLEVESARSRFRAEEEEREEMREEHLEAEAVWKAWLTRLAGVPLVAVCVYLVVTHIAGG